MATKSDKSERIKSATKAYYQAIQEGSITLVEAANKVVEEGFGYLFAETTPFTFNQYHFCIMPRIKGKTYCGWNGIYDFLTDEEADFIDDHFYDLHNENWKLVNGNPIIFDYAANNL